MRGETNMEEFTSIAIWVLIIFFSVNATIVWFDSSSTFTDNGLSLGVTKNESFNIEKVEESKTDYYSKDCSTSTSNPLDYSLCLLSTIGDAITSFITLPGRIIGGLWTLSTAWIGLLQIILIIIPGGQIFVDLLVVFFVIIQFTALFIITMKIAGIIRGGS
jgi:hypothetical protein